MTKLKVARFSTLEEARSHYLGEVDRLAEAERAKYITTGNGQALTYEEKRRQALDGGGPMITAEAEALEMTEQRVIDSVLTARAQWEQVGSQIEAKRLKAKKKIRQASTPAEMHAISKSAFD